MDMMDSIMTKALLGGNYNVLNDEGKIENIFMPEWSLVNSVDLDHYGIGQVILGLFSQGGGSTTVDIPSAFWEKVSVKNEIYLHIGYQGFTFLISGITRIVRFDENNRMNCVNVSFSFMATDEAGNSYTISVSIVAVDATVTMVNVKVA